MTEILARRLSLNYHSFIIFTSFESVDDKFSPYSDGRMTAILEEYMEDVIALC